MTVMFRTAPSTSWATSLILALRCKASIAHSTVALSTANGKRQWESGYQIAQMQRNQITKAGSVRVFRARNLQQQPAVTPFPDNHTIDARSALPRPSLDPAMPVWRKPRSIECLIYGNGSTKSDLHTVLLDLFLVSHP